MMKGKIFKDFKFLFFLVPFLIIGFIISINLTSKHTSGTFEKYPLVKCGESINIMVISASTFKGTSLVIDKNKQKHSIRAFNWNLKDSYLQNHLLAGDSISRNAHSDILYLYKKDGSVIEFEFQCLE